MVVFPNCKINIGLQVLSKRRDGYHNINTIFYPVPFTDVLEIVPQRNMKSGIAKFSSSGLLIPGRSENNLCIKAYNLLHQKHKLPSVKMHLHKIIPMGAGLGGGSSNAAFTLSLLNNLFSLKETNESLKKMAALLGSDCAFFLDNKPSIGSGRGTVLSKSDMNLKGKNLVILNPAVHISTAAAYANIKLTKNLIDYKLASKLPLSEWADIFTNDFETYAFKSYPIIKKIKEGLFLAGAEYACMSGSGSSVYAVSDTKLKLPEKIREFVIWEGILD